MASRSTTKSPGAAPRSCSSTASRAASGAGTPQVRALSRYRRVIAYDVRGHGLSDAPPEAAAYSQATSVADLHALLAHLKIGRAVVGGLSMGGEHCAELRPRPSSDGQRADRRRHR